MKEEDKKSFQTKVGRQSFSTTCVFAIRRCLVVLCFAELLTQPTSAMKSPFPSVQRPEVSSSLLSLFFFSYRFIKS